MRIKKNNFPPFLFGEGLLTNIIPLAVCGGFFLALNLLVNIKVQKNH